MLSETETPATGDLTASLSRRHMVMGGALVAVSAFAIARDPRETFAKLAKGSLDKLISQQIDAWRYVTTSGLVLPPADPMKDALYNDILTRVYSAPNLPTMMLCVAYSNSQNGMLQLHRPEVCYPASGYHLSATRVRPIGIGKAAPIPARYFSAEGVSRSEEVAYWTRIGTEMPTTWLDQRSAVMRANIKGYIPDGILVRVSSPESGETVLPLIEKFIIALVGGLSPAAYKLLISG
jgi:EpsI family protein